MNYTIGGNVSMTEYKRYYYRNSALSLLRDLIKMYVEDEMINERKIGRSELTTQVMDNLIEEIYIDVCSGLNSVKKQTTSEDLGDNILSNRDRKFFYKKNDYNLNLLGERAKVKVWLGPAARIARENYLVGYDKYPEYHTTNTIFTKQRDIYRIEIYKLVQGFTFDDLLRKEPGGCWYDVRDEAKKIAKEQFIEKIKQSNKNGSLIESVIEMFATYITQHIHPTQYMGVVYYPNDCNPGNFVVDYDSVRDFPYNVVNIDHDHITITNYKQMIHNVSWQFFSRFFDEVSLSDEIASDEVIAWRKKNDLFETVEAFKMRYFKVADIDYDTTTEAFDYGISQASLNGSDVLREYVELKQSTYNIKEEVKELDDNDLE